METPKYFAPSVDMAARILEFLSRYATKKSTLSEISSTLEINKSTCLRVLKTMETHNLVYQDPDTLKYSLGVGAVVLGSRANENLEYLSHIKGTLVELSEKTGLTTAFIQRISKNRLMVVAQHETNREPHVILSVGNKFPITESSYGKWFLAFANEDEREEILSQGLKQITEITITNPDLYRKQLDGIKREGVQVSIDEYYQGITGFSFPIFGSKNQILGVMIAVALTETLTKNHIDNIIKELKGFSNRFKGRSTVNFRLGRD